MLKSLKSLYKLLTGGPPPVPYKPWATRPSYMVEVWDKRMDRIMWHETFIQKEDANNAFLHLSSVTFPEPNYSVTLYFLDTGRFIPLVQKTGDGRGTSYCHNYRHYDQH